MNFLFTRKFWIPYLVCGLIFTGWVVKDWNGCYLQRWPNLPVSTTMLPITLLVGVSLWPLYLITTAVVFEQNERRLCMVGGGTFVENRRQLK